MARMTDEKIRQAYGEMVNTEPEERVRILAQANRIPIDKMQEIVAEERPKRGRKRQEPEAAPTACQPGKAVDVWEEDASVVSLRREVGRRRAEKQEEIRQGASALQKAGLEKIQMLKADARFYLDRLNGITGELAALKAELKEQGINVP